MISNALLQLKKINHKWTENLTVFDTLKILYFNTDEFITDVLIIYNITFVEIDLKFKRKLIIDYIKNQFL